MVFDCRGNASGLVEKREKVEGWDIWKGDMRWRGGTHTFQIAEKKGVDEGVERYWTKPCPRVPGGQQEKVKTKAREGGGKEDTRMARSNRFLM